MRGQEAVYAECNDWGEERVQAYVDTHTNDPERLLRLEWLNRKMRAASKHVADSEWAAASPEIQRALEVSWANGMPSMASAVYSRWWQLETWLRSLVYVELRAALGSEWVDALPKASESRQLGEQEFRYMKTPDAQNRLAYTDASTLFKITQERWSWFEDSLLSKNVWAGRIEELLAIRNRIGHCRRPHADDLVRLEQTLRDLNDGAFRATSAFNRKRRPDKTSTDPVVDAWVRMEHDDASHLVEHAKRQYETNFTLLYSRRPWIAKSAREEPTISGVPGYIWHASWFFRGSRPFDLRQFWQDIKPYHDAILLVCADNPFSIEVSFSAMNDPKSIADAIGLCFDAALSNVRPGREPHDPMQWAARFAERDPRVHIVTPWSLVDDSMQGLSIFSA